MVVIAGAEYLGRSFDTPLANTSMQWHYLIWLCSTHVHRRKSCLLASMRRISERSLSTEESQLRIEAGLTFDIGAFSLLLVFFGVVFVGGVNTKWGASLQLQS